MIDEKSNSQSYSERVTSGAERIARRMGGQFVPNQNWETVVKAGSNGRSAAAK
jgi:hypothetical protein